MSASTIPNRRERRRHMKAMGFFKYKNKLNFQGRLELFRKNNEQGKEIHEQNMERFERTAYEQVEEIWGTKMSFYKELGYTDEEITKLQEAFSILVYKDIDTWKEDKKRARAIMKEVDQSWKARKNG